MPAEEWGLWLLVIAAAAYGIFKAIHDRTSPSTGKRLHIFVVVGLLLGLLVLEFIAKMNP